MHHNTSLNPESLWNSLHCTLLCYSERNTKASWQPMIPSEFRLTEADIDSFVQCLSPVLKLALFTRRGIYEVALTVKNLTELRPNMILPELMERCVWVCLYSRHVHVHTSLLVTLHVNLWTVLVMAVTQAEVITVCIQYMYIPFIQRICVATTCLNNVDYAITTTIAHTLYPPPPQDLCCSRDSNWAPSSGVHSVMCNCSGPHTSIRW